ncbi:MAG TPA: GntR family transcriptional regulator [Chthoniobacterales bacterium]
MLSPSINKREEITRQLRDELLRGRYGEEGRLPSEAQLVRRFAVSRPTVARALLSLVEEGLVERRAGSGTFAKGFGGKAGRPLLETRVLALLIPDLGNTEIFQLICAEIASLARVHNYSLVWGGSGEAKLDTDPGLQHAEELCRQFIERRVSGVFFAPYELVPDKEETNRRLTVMLREAGIPVVLLDRDLCPFPFRSDFDVVGVDNVGGGYMLAEHLLKLGCRRLHFVARPLSAPTVDGRIAGVREALARSGVAPEPGWIHIGVLDDKSFVNELIAEPLPDAFICANDHTAALLLRALKQNNVRVPEDVRVVGFDDVNFATLVSPALTTVQQPCRDIATSAFCTMLNRLSDPTLPPCHVTLAPRLIARDSCGANSSADNLKSSVRRTAGAAPLIRGASN